MRQRRLDIVGGWLFFALGVSACGGDLVAKRSDGSPMTSSDGSPMTSSDGSPMKNSDGPPRTSSDGSANPSCGSCAPDGLWKLMYQGGPMCGGSLPDDELTIAGDTVKLRGLVVSATFSSDRCSVSVAHSTSGTAGGEPQCSRFDVTLKFCGNESTATGQATSCICWGCESRGYSCPPPNELTPYDVKAMRQ